MKQIIGVETLKESIELLTDYRNCIGEEYRKWGDSNRFTKMLFRRVHENISMLERTIGKLDPYDLPISKEEYKKEGA